MFYLTLYVLYASEIFYKLPKGTLLYIYKPNYVHIDILQGLQELGLNSLYFIEFPQTFTKKVKKVIPGFEPGLFGSEPKVITTTLYNQISVFLCADIIRFLNQRFLFMSKKNFDKRGTLTIVTVL